VTVTTTFVILMLGLYIAYVCKNLTTLASAFQRYDWFTWPDHATFRDDLPSVGYWARNSYNQSYLPHLKSLFPPTT